MNSNFQINSKNLRQDLDTMPFAERNPPDVLILPGPNYKYLNGTPPSGHTHGFG